MELPLELTFRGVNNKEELEEIVRRKVDKLERFSSNIISCHVAVEQLVKHHKKGNPYHVRIDVRIPPGHEIVVKHEPKGTSDESVEITIRDAFESMQRQIKKLNDKQHNKIKSHDNKIELEG